MSEALWDLTILMTVSFMSAKSFPISLPVAIGRKSKLSQRFYFFKFSKKAMLLRVISDGMSGLPSRSP